MLVEGDYCTEKEFVRTLSTSSSVSCEFCDQSNKRIIEGERRVHTACLTDASSCIAEQEIVIYRRTGLGRDMKSVQDAECMHQILPRGNKSCANEEDVEKMTRACSEQNGHEY